MSLNKVRGGGCRKKTPKLITSPIVLSTREKYNKYCDLTRHTPQEIQLKLQKRSFSGLGIGASVTFYVAQTEVSLTIENQIIKNSKFEKLLGIKLDSKLNFNSHIHDICQKARQKLNAISRITPYMDFARRRLIINAFFYSQFNYCQLVWMCHNRTNNDWINRLHERCLRLIYNDKKS